MERKSFSSREQRLGLAIVGLVGVAVFTGYAVTAHSRAERFSEAILTILLAAAMLRLISARVVLTADGELTVVNAMRTIRLRAAEVSAVRIGRWGILPRIALIDLFDGRCLHAFGIQGPNPAFRAGNQSAERLVEELNERIRSSR
jgi:hypothetical protein